MTRIALGIEYNGAHYNGWQRQNHNVSVQLKLEEAASSVANHPVIVHCAGRTDSGVHATGQVVHFDSDAEREPHNWLLGINANLPDDVAVQWVKPVSDEFHARYAAVARRYRYIICNRAARPAILAKRVTWERYPLDEQRMHEAAQYLIGEHDFTSYRASYCQAKSPFRCMKAFDVTRQGDFVYIDVYGDAFLHHMVRNITGVLMAIGRHEQPVNWSKTVLDAKDRKEGGITAPPDGLYLAYVEYPPEWGLDAPIRRPHYHFS